MTCWYTCICSIRQTEICDTCSIRIEIKYKYVDTWRYIDIHVCSIRQRYVDIYSIRQKSIDTWWYVDIDVNVCSIRQKYVDICSIKQKFVDTCTGTCIYVDTCICCIRDMWIYVAWSSRFSTFGNICCNPIE